MLDTTLVGLLKAFVVTGSAQLLLWGFPYLQLGSRFFFLDQASFNATYHKPEYI